VLQSLPSYQKQAPSTHFQLSSQFLASASSIRIGSHETAGEKSVTGNEKHIKLEQTLGVSSFSSSSSELSSYSLESYQ
jgi:hypothetical protein